MRRLLSGAHSAQTTCFPELSLLRGVNFQFVRKSSESGHTLPGANRRLAYQIEILCALRDLQVDQRTAQRAVASIPQVGKIVDLE